MDINPLSEQKPISDDQDLAKALAGVLPDAPLPEPEEIVTTVAPTAIEPAAPAAETANPSPLPQPSIAPLAPAPVAPSTTDTESAALPEAPAAEETRASNAAPSDLENIKRDALGELRPLIGKVDLPAEEKFDTYLLLIRSTDDTSLIAPAHTAAQEIGDEKRRAEALLDIIKEIDYLSRKEQ